KIKNFTLLNEPKILEIGIGILFDVGENHLAWIANQKTIRQLDNPLMRNLRKQMVSHLFLEKNPFPIRQRPFRERRDDFVQIGLARSDNLVGDRMLLARLL